MTPSGIEPASFRFVTQHLNHCATAVPNLRTKFLKICQPRIHLNENIEGGITSQISSCKRPNQIGPYYLASLSEKLQLNCTIINYSYILGVFKRVNQILSKDLSTTKDK